MFAVHVTSPRIRERAHGWRVGDAFTGRTAIDRCECWGNPDERNEVAACYRIGSHIALVFERGAHGLACAGELDAKSFTGVLGTRIDRLVWKRKAFGPA
ncbi:MAG: hypothetical protein KF773_29010 [Deltaproteobacteria bacterium]|nr:hypothetical protein [Deltaproteobacteria bacterium]